MIEHDIAPHSADLACVRRILLDRRVHDLQKPLEARHTVLVLLHKGDEPPHRIHENADIQNERREIADVYLSVRAENAARDVENNLQKIANEGGTALELRHDLIRAASCLHKFRVSLIELLVFKFLTGVCLGHADPGDAVFEIQY